MVSETGVVQQRNNYFPYGDLFPNTSNGSSGNRYKYTGKESGDEIGLYDFSARFLHTRFGRFTTIDPLAEKYPGIKLYQGGKDIYSGISNIRTGIDILLLPIPSPVDEVSGVIYCIYGVLEAAGGLVKTVIAVDRLE